MKPQIKLGVLALIGSGLLCYQCLHMPVQILKSGQAFGPAQIDQWRDDERSRADATKILQGFRCERGYVAEIVAAHRESGIPASIVAATVVSESGCKPSVVSKGNAVGLMQVEPFWGYSREQLKDPATNIRAGAKILGLYTRRAGSVRGGLRLYFGVSAGSDEADIYADKVLTIARRK